jgi:hypothetical protein
VPPTQRNGPVREDWEINRHFRNSLCISSLRRAVKDATQRNDIDLVAYYAMFPIAVKPPFQQFPLRKREPTMAAVHR